MTRWLQREEKTIADLVEGEVAYLSSRHGSHGHAFEGRLHSIQPCLLSSHCLSHLDVILEALVRTSCLALCELKPAGSSGTQGLNDVLMPETLEAKKRGTTPSPLLGGFRCGIRNDMHVFIERIPFNSPKQ